MNPKPERRRYAGPANFEPIHIFSWKNGVRVEKEVSGDVVGDKRRRVVYMMRRSWSCKSRSLLRFSYRFYFSRKIGKYDVVVK